MKIVSLWTLAAAVVLFPGVGGSLAFAQGGGGNEDGHSPPPSVLRQLRHRLLHRFDENGNGRLDHRESHQALQTVLGVLSRNRGRAVNISELPAGLRSIFAMFDRNGDGVLGPIERGALGHAMRHAAKPPRRPHPPRPPGDGEDGAGKPKPKPKPPGDGDADEDGEDGPNRPHPPRLTPELLRQLRALLLAAFDRNHNHRLDPPERGHARRVLMGFLSRHRGEVIDIASAPPRLGQILGLFDFNGDGKLGPAEKRLLHRALQIVLRPRPRPEPGEPGDGDRPKRPRPDRPIGDDLDDSQSDDRPADGGFEVRPGHPPRPDF